MSKIAKVESDLWKTYEDMVHVKSWKKLRKGLFSNTHNLLLQMYLHLKL